MEMCPTYKNLKILNDPQRQIPGADIPSPTVAVIVTGNTGTMYLHSKSTVCVLGTWTLGI